MIDAGHISIRSDFGDKKALKAIQQKRKQPFTDQDYEQLESLMYDKFFLTVKSAQFVIGNDLESSLAALDENTDALHLHLLERVNIDLSLQKSIVPSAAHLPKLKVAGTLPKLKANFSDTKYKALMRFIDVAVPKLGDGPPVESVPAPLAVRPDLKDKRPSFRLTAGLFAQETQEYIVHENEEEQPEDGGEVDEFFEAQDGLGDLHQHVVDLDFTVDTVEATLSKTARDGTERPLGDVVLQQFGLNFVMQKFDMKVDVRLQCVQ